MVVRTVDYQHGHTTMYTSRFVQKVVVALVFFAVFVWAYLAGAQDYFSLAQMQTLLGSLIAYVNAAPFLAAIVLVGVYVGVTGFSIPGATVLTLLAGALFGVWIGTFLVNVGATLGATLAFLSARFVVGEGLQKRYAPALERFNAEIAEHGAHYMLTLRLVPIFPFFLVNALAGISAVPLRTFVWTTSLGIIPGSLVYTFAGRQFATITDVAALISPPVLMALVLLGLFSLAPVVYKKWQARAMR